MQSQMCSYLPYAITILLNRLCYRCAPLPHVRSNITTEQLLKGRPVSISLTAGYLGDIALLLQMIGQLINESFLAQKCLPPHLGPDRLLPYPPRYELTVLLLGLSPLSTELA